MKKVVIFLFFACSTLTLAENCLDDVPFQRFELKADRIVSRTDHGWAFQRAFSRPWQSFRVMVTKHESAALAEENYMLDWGGTATHKFDSPIPSGLPLGEKSMFGGAWGSQGLRAQVGLITVTSSVATRRNDDRSLRQTFTDQHVVLIEGLARRALAFGLAREVQAGSDQRRGGRSIDTFVESDGSVLADVRQYAEAVGAGVSVDELLGTVTLRKGATSLVLPLAAKSGRLGDRWQALDSWTVNVSGRPFVSLAVLDRTFGS